MPDSILERITLAIKARLEGITVAGSYTVTVPAVYRPTKSGIPESPQNYSITLTEGDDTPIDAESNMHNGWMQEYSLALNVVPADGSTDAIGKLVNEFRGQVHKAIMTDPYWTSGADRLAINTFLMGCERFSGQGDPPGYDGATLKIVVQYRTLETDPYTL